MYTPDITLGTQTYSLQAQRANSSVRSDASQPLSEPNTLTISHELAKSGRYSTAVMLDDTKIVSLVGATTPVPDTVRTMFKLQYNPLAGRTDVDADITNAIAQLIVFLSDPTNVDKLLNKES